MNERRQLPRWDIKKEIKVWIQQVQGFNQCVVKDMHLKGMCVSSQDILPEQKPLNISFSIGDDPELIKVEADVPWEKEDQGQHVYGLSFSKMDDFDKDRIYKYISTNCYDQIKNKWWA